MNDRTHDVAAPADDQAIPAESATIAAGMIQIAQAATVDVPLPGPLEHIELQTQSDTLYELPDGAEGLRVYQNGGNLLLAFPNGGIVEFTGFSDSRDVEFHSADRGTQNAGRFVSEIEQHEVNGTLPPQSPLFTPGPEPHVLGALEPPAGALVATDLALPKPEDVSDIHLLLRDHGILPVGDAAPSSPDQTFAAETPGHGLKLQHEDVLGAEEPASDVFAGGKGSAGTPLSDLLYSGGETHLHVLPSHTGLPGD
jgi:hypothetical protein